MNAASPILFDLDGTLLDTHDMILESMQYTINEVDGQNQNDEKLMAGVGTRCSIKCSISQQAIRPVPKSS